MQYASRFCRQTDNANGTTTFTGRYLGESREHSVTVPNAGLLAYYYEGALIQNAFPLLTEDDREFLMTGLSPETWSSL